MDLESIRYECNNSKNVRYLLQSVEGNCVGMSGRTIYSIQYRATNQRMLDDTEDKMKEVNRSTLHFLFEDKDRADSIIKKIDTAIEKNKQQKLPKGMKPSKVQFTHIEADIERVQWSEDHRQITLVKFCTTKNCFIGNIRCPYTGHQDVVTLENSWVKKNLPKVLQEEVRNRSKFTRMPVGRSMVTKGHKPCPPYEDDKVSSVIPTSTTYLRFQQGSLNTCAMDSICSAIFASGEKSPAEEINSKCRCLIKDPLWCIHAFRNTMIQVSTIMKRKWKITATQKVPWQDMLDRQPKSIQMMLVLQTDGCKSHAVALMDGMVYDSNFGYAYKLDAQGIINMSNGEGVVSFVLVYDFQKKHSAKLSRNCIRKNRRTKNKNLRKLK